MDTAIPVVEQLKADLQDQPGNALRPSQVQGYQDELAQLGVMAQGRDLDGVPREFLQSAKGGAVRRAQQVRKILDTQAAKRVTGERANRIHARVKDTLDTVIRPAMLPRSAMRRNVPGAVGHLLRTEFNPVFKDAILQVKRGLRALDPDNSDPDFTNMERFRPEGLNPDGTSTFAADAQIPGLFALTPLAKEHWPLGEPTARTAVGEIREREKPDAPSSMRKPEHAATEKRARTPAQIVATERMRTARAANLAQRTEADQTA